MIPSESLRNKGNDHELKKLLIVSQIFPTCTLWNVQKTVWRMYIHSDFKVNTDCIVKYSTYHVESGYQQLATAKVYLIKDPQWCSSELSGFLLLPFSTSISLVLTCCIQHRLQEHCRETYSSKINKSQF